MVTKGGWVVGLQRITNTLAAITAMRSTVGIGIASTIVRIPETLSGHTATRALRRVRRHIAGPGNT